MKRRTFLNGVAASFCGVWTSSAFADVLASNESTIGENLPRNVVLRGSYANSKRLFETSGVGRVAFLGGSITEMDGYRPMICDYLTTKFPKTKFDFVDAGISSTCSDVGAFRIETDVLKNGPVDLFFVEFAVNDDQDGNFNVEHSIRGFEGIIRKMRRENPNVDMVTTFFVNERLMNDYRDGKVAPSIQAHLQVAERYGISTINLAKEIQERIDEKTLTWEEFGGVHPAPRGNRICAEMIAALLDSAWTGEPAETLVAHSTPAPLDAFSYDNGAFRGWIAIETNVGKIADETPVADGGFRLCVPNWAKIGGGFRDRFGGVPLLCAEKPGSEITFQFEGTLLALYVLAGPDAGIVEFQIDGGDWKKANVFHPFSGGLHYPRAVVLADELARTKRHSVVLRTSAEKDEKSAGNALRILQICINR